MPDTKISDAALSAACRVLDSEGRRLGWWPLDCAEYDRMDPISKGEFETLTARILAAGREGRG